MLQVKPQSDLVEQLIEKPLNFKRWLPATQRGKLKRENADLQQQLDRRDAQIAELSRQLRDFRPLQEIVGDEETELLQAAVPEFVNQLQLARDALRADLSNHLDAPEFEKNSLTVARNSARTLMEAALHMGEEKKSSIDR